MKLVIHYLNKVGIAADLQSGVFLFFFLLFLFIMYVIIKGNKQEYREYGNMPLKEDSNNSEFMFTNKN